MILKTQLIKNMALFEGTLKSGHLFRNVVDSVKDLLTDVNIYVSEHGIQIGGMDSSHVSLIKCVLSSNDFTHFECKKEGQIGVNIQNISKILKCITNDDSLKLYSSDTHLNIVFQSENGKSEFELNLIEIDSEDIDIPEMEGDATIKMLSSKFHNIINSLSIIGLDCKISCINNKLKFETSGDLGYGNVSIEKEEIDISSEKDVINSYSLKYLSHFCKGTCLNPLILIKLCEDQPLCVTFNLANSNNSYLDYYLAPRIEDDD